MKKNWITIVLILIVLLIVGYLGRHTIKAMLGMSKPVPATQVIVTPTKPATQAMMVSSDNIYKVATDKAKGQYITDFQGMALYTYDKDTSGVSNCSAGCLKVWPIYTSGATAQKSFPKNITVIIRDDNTKQFAWMGKPLYYYATDSKVGDTMGDGVGGVWHLVKP